MSNCDHCNGHSRRDFLRKLAGSGVALGFMGLSLPSRLFLQEAYGIQPEGAFYDAAIQIFFNGGPSQTDTWDPKPGSRNNVFRTINLGVKDRYNQDVHISEVFPTLANQVMNDPAVGLGLFRSMVHRNNDHGTAQQYMNNFWEGALAMSYPSTASVMAYYFQGQGVGIPSVVINGGLGTDANVARDSKCPTALQVDAGQNQNQNPVVQALSRPQGVDQARYDRRRALLDRLNRRYLDSRPDTLARDYERATKDALDVTARGEAARAFDLTGKPLLPARDQGTSRRLTLAQELIKAGVPYVSMGIGGNDSHDNNMQIVQANWGQSIDQGVSAMVQNLKATGKRVLIVMGGEFGRTPNTVANGRNGRDHWGDGFSWAAISVNQPKFRTSAYGQTGPDGMWRERDGNLVDPVHPRDLGAFVYRSLGFPIGLPRFDIPLNTRAAPPVDRMNQGNALLSTFGLI